MSYAVAVKLTEPDVLDALMLSRGDLFVAATHLGCSIRQLDIAIRASDDLQLMATSIGTVKASVEYDRMSADQFSEQLEAVTRAYRLEAIEVIHDMAVMEFDSAAMAEVKLKAAIQLREVQHDGPQKSDQVAVLHELNQLYQQSAPRIRSIRIAQIEMD